jgi:D-arginine dehydrogenase
LAGLPPIGLQPKRRTALIVACPEPYTSGEHASDGWPAVIDVSEQFYMKPDAGRLLISPADETPSPPCDAQPDEMDVAICVDRIQAAFDLPVSRIENRWAGLRSFVADKCPVCGFDSNADGFFWLAGQGGYGIQSAPALSRVAAALVMRRNVPADILDHGFDPADLSPDRAALERS